MDQFDHDHINHFTTRKTAFYGLYNHLLQFGTSSPPLQVYPAVQARHRAHWQARGLLHILLRGLEEHNPIFLVEIKTLAALEPDRTRAAADADMHIFLI